MSNTKQTPNNNMNENTTNFRCCDLVIDLINRNTLGKTPKNPNTHTPKAPTCQYEELRKHKEQTTHIEHNTMLEQNELAVRISKSCYSTVFVFVFCCFCLKWLQCSNFTFMLYCVVVLHHVLRLLKFETSTQHKHID